MPFDGFILGNKLIILHPKEKFEFIEGKPTNAPSKPLNTWNSSVWQRVKGLKASDIEQIHIREQAYQQIRAILSELKSEQYAIFETEKFKRALFINHPAITLNDIRKIFSDFEVIERKRGKRKFLIFRKRP